MADEGFHEIQLGKKQLFFAGMAAALYSVVVFSLGVWVGQDVRRPESEVAAEAAPDAPADSTPAPTKVAPSELDYAARMSGGTAAAAAAAPATPPEVKPVEPPSPPDSEVAATSKATPPAVKTPPAVEKSAPAAKTTPPPVAAKNGVLLQVAAFNDDKTAQSLATKLKAKGYAAFVFTATGVPFPYKVRVGPMADKAEADRVTARLKKEEGLSPFPTR